MGDLANMTDDAGWVDGRRLVLWLRSREQMERAAARATLAPGMCQIHARPQARADLLRDMAMDLEERLMPPDGPYDPDDGVDLDDPAMTVDPDERNQS